VKHRLDDSPTWTNLLKVRKVYLKGRQIKTKNGKNTLFWEDCWLTDKPICKEHTVLYDMCNGKLISVHEVLRKNGHLSFNRWLPSLLFDEWLALIGSVFSYNFENQNDVILWKWNNKKVFTTKSVYNHLSAEENTNAYKHIWKSKIPHKIKIFTWLLERGVILTKDNLVKRKWDGNPSCMFCDQLETIDHLFFQCPVAKCVWAMIGQCIGANNTPRDCAQYKLWINMWLPEEQNVHHFGFAAVCWAIWKCRNKAVFDAKLIRHPAEVLLHSCAFMKYWAGLYSSDFHGRLLGGVKVILACAHKVLAQQAGDPTNRLLLPPPGKQAEDEE